MPLTRRAAAAVAAVALAASATGCSEPPATTAAAVDIEHGRQLLRQYGCGKCHRIPGVADAVGVAGPPLDGIGRRVYLAGVVPNDPDTLVRWIVAPQRIDPMTAMPDMQVPEHFARQMAAYLVRLR